MSAITAVPALRPRTRTHTGRVTQLRVARSEWTKLRTLRSTRFTLFAGVALTIVFAVIPALVNAARWSRMSVIDKAGFHALETSLIGVSFAQLAFGVLGVIIISGEYSTGMIRSSFTAVPKRLPVLWAKAGVYSVVGLAVTVPSTLIAFFVGQS